MAIHLTKGQLRKLILQETIRLDSPNLQGLDEDTTWAIDRIVNNAFAEIMDESEKLGIDTDQLTLMVIDELKEFVPQARVS